MPHPNQPFLHNLIMVLAAPTQMLSQRNGEITTSPDQQTAQGMIHADVRVLNHLAVRVNGERVGGRDAVLEAGSTYLLQAGKRGIARVTIKRS